MDIIPYKKILIPIDGSVNSIKAVAHGRLLAVNTLDTKKPHPVGCGFFPFKILAKISLHEFPRDDFQRDLQRWYLFL